MRFSARLERAIWGWPSFPEPGSSHLRWARYSHYLQRFLKFNRAGLTEDNYGFDLSPAIDFFGLKWPVTLWVQPFPDMGNIKSRAWYFDSVETEHRHTITVADSLSAADASALCWHELTHAYQSERICAIGIGLNRKYEFSQAAFPIKVRTWRDYASSRFEREAYEAMNNHYSVAKLTLDI